MPRPPASSCSVARHPSTAWATARCDCPDRPSWDRPATTTRPSQCCGEPSNSGVNHIDTSDYYGPHTVNQLIREALHPYPEDLVLVTKVGARRTPDGGWPAALSAAELTSAVHDNLRNLGVDRIDVVNLRMADSHGGQFVDGSLAEPYEVLAGLREQGLIHHLGVSNVGPVQVDEAQSIAPVVCVQNMYNIAARGDDALIEACAAQGIAFTPFFPVGGFSPLQNGRIDALAKESGVSSMQLALAWLLARSPNVLAIPGTSSVTHLDENLARSPDILDCKRSRRP